MAGKARMAPHVDIAQQGSSTASVEMSLADAKRPIEPGQ